MTTFAAAPALIDLNATKSHLGIKASVLDNLLGRARKAGHTIPVTTAVRVPCTRCGGSGIWTKFHGTCFRCGGRKTDPTPSLRWTLDGTTPEAKAFVAGELDKLVSRREKAAVKKTAKRDADVAVMLAAHPVVAELDAILVDDAQKDLADALPQFVWDIHGKARGRLTLSVKQDAALVNTLANTRSRLVERAEQRESAEDAPEGRVTITGTVLSVKVKETNFGSRLVMTVRDDRGFLVWGTVPASLDEVENGSKVKFVAALTRSDKDAKFAFFKRPTKAEVL